MNGKYYYGTRSRGIAITNLSENSYKEENGKATKIVKKIPGKTIFINEKDKQINKLLSQNYENNINDYYSNLRLLGTNSNYLDGDFAVNENKLAVNIGGKVRVYDLKSLRVNYKYKKLAEYERLATESQGIALSGKENEVLKLYQDKNNAIIERYNSNSITTKKKIETDVASVNLSSYYGSNKFKVEGIKVYQENGKYYVYLGVARLNVSPRENDVIRIKYDDLVFNRKSRSI